MALPCYRHASGQGWVQQQGLHVAVRTDPPQKGAKVWVRRRGPPGDGWYEGKVVLAEEGPTQTVRVMFQDGSLQAYARHCLGTQHTPTTQAPTDTAAPQPPIQPPVAESGGKVGAERGDGQDTTQPQDRRQALMEGPGASLALSFSNISGLATVPRAQGAEVRVLVDVGPRAAVASSQVTAQCLQCTVGPRALRLVIDLPLGPAS